RRIVLLVLYTLPGSRPRMAQLAQRYDTLVTLGTEVIAVPTDAASDAVRRLGAEPRVFFPVVTDGAGEIVAADRLFATAPHAARAAAATVEREWTAEGVVRAILPEINVMVLTHGEMPGYMPAMTMGFRAASPKIHESVRVGDAVRFTVRGVPPNVAITAIERAR